jgi:branched-chain amino acid transport system ATP-binding protein
MPPLLELQGVSMSFGGLQVISDLDLHVDEGEIVSVIGPNGAGKTTLLRTISGLLQPTSGVILLHDEPLSGLAPDRIVREGLVHCPEGRRPFAELEVIENLLLGMPLWKSRDEADARLAEVFQLFPRLRERQHQLAGTLSGGEQQMLALGRALMCRPKLLMLDEPSMGLAPKVVEEVFSAIGKIRAMGVTVLLVEQNVELALDVCETVAVLDHGRLVFNGTRAELMRDARLKEVYLGLA